MNKKKRIISIILIALVVLLGGASIYVATQLSTRKSVAPTAPQSKPKASEPCEVGLSCSTSQVAGSTACTQASGTEVWCCPAEKVIVNGACLDKWVGCADCTVTGLVTVADCVPDGTVTCNPDCPTTCGLAASTITTCTDSCGGATTKACPATAACACVPDGTITCNPDCPTTCGLAASTITTCTDSCDEATTKACPATAACACVPDGTITCNPDCPVTCGTAASTVTCTDSCGGASTKACPATAACGADGGWSAWSVCSATACGTSGTKTRVCNNPAPTGIGAECTRTDETLTTPTSRTETIACSAAACPVVTAVPTVVAQATPTILPETGIFDLPGIVAFGGGLFLAVIGILLAL